MRFRIERFKKRLAPAIPGDGSEHVFQREPQQDDSIRLLGEGEPTVAAEAGHYLSSRWMKH